jgi:hypothetical protein
MPKMREWKEIGNLLLTDSGVNLIIRVNSFKEDSDEIRSIDALLGTEEMHELYIILKNKLETVLKNKDCLACKYYRYGCKHPNEEVRGYVCDREQRKYFEPKYQI